MHLKHLNINDQLKKQVGLTIPDLDLRSNIIGIVGKNGAGKTRFLRCIYNHIIQNGQIIRQAGEFGEIPATLAHSQPQVFNNLVRNLVIRISSQQIINLKINANQKSNNSISISIRSLINSDNELPQLDEMNVLNSDGLAFFTSLCTRLYLEKVNYTDKDPASFKKTKLYQNFKSLKEKFLALTDKELDYRFVEGTAQIDASGSASGIRAIWTLNDRDFNYEELSEGEKTLFWYILLLFVKENYHYSKTKNSIIILDEPELHLHPEAQFKLLNGLTELIGKTGQLIIATHSLSILSCFNFDQIYLTDSNEIFPPNSMRPSEALNRLIGGTEELFQMKNFISNVSNWAYDQFMINNFNDPDVIATSKSNDPQFELFQKILKGNNINMLDFGCGQGRLLKLLEADNNLKAKFSRLDAFEPNPNFSESLQSIGCVSNVYAKLSEIDKKYDIILLTNVLHEIRIDEIVKSLNKIRSSLSKDGFIVIIEDLVLRKGEKPNDNNGYLVFSGAELSYLLKTEGKHFELKHSNAKYKDRIMCFVASYNSFKQTDKNSLESALKKLKERSKEQLKSIKSNNSYDKGRTYGFYAQQYINAELAIEEFS